MKSVYNIFARWNSVILLSVIYLVLSWNCSNPEHKSGFNTNIRPKTRLSNIPRDSTKAESPQLTLNWVGDDPDGYVVGFKYTWTYRIGGQESIHPDKIILNLIVEKFALMILTDNEKILPSIYKYFATIDPEVGLDVTLKDSLNRGDTITISGIKIYASNSDSIRIQTGQRIKNSFPVHTSPNSGTFIFDSPDKTNFHVFMVSAIDNIGESSIQPATVSFETPQVLPPHTRVIGVPDDTVLVIRGTTPTYNGTTFRFQGIDPQGWTVEYRWVVDKNQWLAKTGKIPWSKFGPSEYASVTAADFPDPYATKHTFYVQCRNAYGVIDTVGYSERIVYAPGGERDSIGVTIDSAWYSFNTIYPPFARKDIPPVNKILLINNTYVNILRPTSPSHPSPATVADYYHDIFVNSLGIPDSLISIWTVTGNQRENFPGRNEIGKYKLVVMFSDATNTGYIYEKWSVGPDRQAILRDYCYVGGNIIFSGWAMSAPSNLPGDRNYNEFFAHILHVDVRKLAPLGGLTTFDCNGANGRRGYTDLRMDLTKSDSVWNGCFAYTWSNYPEGFGETIHKYSSRSRNAFLEDIPISVRYDGITFNVIYFGLPLYYMQRPAVDSTLAMALRDIQK